MDDTGSVLGVLSERDILVKVRGRPDLVRAFTCSDEEIEREIREDVFVRTFYTTPSNVEVTVEAGEVTLRGRVELEPVARLVPAAVERVPGVVSVTSHLGWRTSTGDEG